jgi:hypothetical protein
MRAPAALIASVLALAGCDRTPGTGRVDAEFSVAECPPGLLAPDLVTFGFDAGYLSTERYLDVVLVQVFRYPVRVEETDGLTLRLDLAALRRRGLLRVDASRGQLVRSDLSRPLEIPLTPGAGEAGAVLSLFGTCPDFPQFPGAEGMVRLTALTLAAEPEDTGEQERLAGTLTATLTRSSTDARVGLLRASFDFTPPRRPLATFN